MKTVVPTFRATVTKGKMVMTDKEYFLSYVAEQPDGEYILTLKRHYDTRSDKQNRYYWGVVVEVLRQEIGYTRDEMHEVLKAKFLSAPEKQMITRKSNKIVVLPEHVKSSANLGTGEFEHYLDEIRQWAAVELNCYIPLPNEASDALAKTEEN